MLQKKVIKMNDLQRLFRLRKITMQQLADQLGMGMHMVQKTVKGVRHHTHIQEAVAGYLGMTVDQCFGLRASDFLRPLIALEIKKLRADYETKLKAKIYHTNSVSRLKKVVNG